MPTLEEVKKKVEKLRSLQLTTEEELCGKTIERIEFNYEVTFIFTDGTFALCRPDEGDLNIQDEALDNYDLWMTDFIITEEYNILENFEREEPTK